MHSAKESWTPRQPVQNLHKFNPRVAEPSPAQSTTSISTSSFLSAIASSHCAGLGFANGPPAPSATTWSVASPSTSSASPNADSRKPATRWTCSPARCATRRWWIAPGKRHWTSSPGYADTWRLLLEYDDNQFTAPPGVQPSRGVLHHDRAAEAIADFKRELTARGQASSLFGNPRGDALEAILGNIEQTMFGEPLYKSREAKAAHLLYFVVKDHPFTDGNKRIGSLLFLLYLKQEDVAHRLNPQALTALTLLIAESAIASKDLMIRLIINLLAEPVA